MNNEYAIMCDRCKRLFNFYSVASCKHEVVNQYYGKHICMYCCMRCQHHKKTINPGGVTCTLTTTNNNL